MIILDTNVVSAVMLPERNRKIVQWLDSHSPSSIWITAITLLESRWGLIAMDEGRRKNQLSDALDNFLVTIERRILPFDTEAAECSARVLASRAPSGRNVSAHDTQIAGIAIARRARLATRNVRDFQDLDVTLINPWD